MIKLIVLVVVGLGILKVFFPQKAVEAIDIISEQTGIDTQVITSGVEFAGELAEDGVDIVKEKAIDMKDEALESIE